MASQKFNPTSPANQKYSIDFGDIGSIDISIQKEQRKRRDRLSSKEAKRNKNATSPATKLEPILGLPPGDHTTEDVIKQSMPIARIIPCEPEFQPGFTLFRLAPKQNLYLDLLNSHGFTTEMPLQVAFLADNFPTDTFANEYGESFLQRATDVGSAAAGEINQIMGTKRATDALKKISGALKGAETESSAVNMGMKAIGSGIEGVQSAATALGNMLADSSGGAGNMMRGGADIVNKMLAGARVDFPQVWKNSGFAPSYTMTIRLYNPNPASVQSTRKHIIGPLCALMLLGVPRTLDGNTYSWPFLHKIRAPGIYNLDPAFISNITIIKGGDQQSIAWNQRLGMVDVRIDFGSLYNSMIAGFNYESKARPTVQNYLDAMEDETKVNQGIMYKDDTGSYYNEGIQTNMADKNMAKNLSKQDPDPETEPASRVSSTNLALESRLQSRFISV